MLLFHHDGLENMNRNQLSMASRRIMLGVLAIASMAFAGQAEASATDIQVSPNAGPTHSGHWAFQPVVKPVVPPNKLQGTQAHPVDAFLQKKLAEQGLTAAPDADARTLVRRATIDLLGIPPTSEDINRYASDRSPDAFARLVDRLLASPLYGERWGRHWLDIARYADTKGYVFEEERRYPYSYTYRDYVIRAFNTDLPYDRFLIEQIAADQLDLGEDKQPLAALGFLTLGRRFLNNIHDIIDDRIDVVFRGTMGVTVGCARCHDHKHDPVQSKDYYSLYGVFASSSEPAEKPLLGKNSESREYPAYLEERGKRTAEFEQFRQTKSAEAVAEVRRRTGDYLWVAFRAAASEGKGEAEAFAREKKLDPGIATQWGQRLKDAAWTNRVVIAQWLAFAALGTNDFAANAKILVVPWRNTATNASSQNSAILKTFADKAPASLQEVAEIINTLCKDVDETWQKLLKTNQPGQELKGLPEPSFESVRQLLYGEGSPAIVSSGEILRLFDVPTAQKVRALQRKLDELDATHPGAPPRAMALVENSTPHNPRVFIRGNPGNSGESVPRQFLGFLTGPNRQPFSKGGGRLELAQSIANRKNPLTARVFVNRVWMHHFGTPLVQTPSDFGLRSEPPSNPDLLNYLAARFMEEEWSVKSLHRLIMLSHAYRQSSAEDPRNAAIDPTNIGYWRMNRKRLDFESGRDSLLAISGRLDLAEGGHATDIATSPESRRRTVYGFIDRQNLPGVFRTFDFASPDTTSAQRFSTTVPQQALYLLNNRFVVEQAKSLLARAEVRKETDLDKKVGALYRIIYQRTPEPDELQISRAFLSQPQSPLETSENDEKKPRDVPWQQLAQALLVSNETFFVD